MPRKKDYSKSTIYHICRKDTKEVIYVGSSCNFSKRGYKHKSCCENPNLKNYDLPLYVYMRDNGGFECFDIIPISLHNLSNINELIILEQLEINKYTTLLNKNRAHRTKDEKDEYQKKYDKEWRNSNKEKVSKIQKKHKEKNKDILAEKWKVYYNENKQSILDKRKITNKETVECDCCGKIVTKVNLTRHKKLLKCINKHLEIKNINVYYNEPIEPTEK
jgi:hypothetical protein